MLNYGYAIKKKYQTSPEMIKPSEKLKKQLNSHETEMARKTAARVEIENNNSIIFVGKKYCLS